VICIISGEGGSGLPSERLHCSFPHGEEVTFRECLGVPVLPQMRLKKNHRYKSRDKGGVGGGGKGGVVRIVLLTRGDLCFANNSQGGDF